MEISRSERDGVVTLTMDDGRKNALDTAAFTAVTAAFDAAADAEAIVLAGRDGIFSAGLNVKFMAGASKAELHELLVAFGRTLMRIWLDPHPVVVAATGHAVAAGTMLAMAADHAVAAEGDHVWGLTETRINFQIPHFGIALSRANVRTDQLEDLLLPGRTVDAATAVEVGFADELAAPEDVVERAQSVAVELAQLPRQAYSGTKRRLRGMACEAVLAGLEDDISALLAFMDQGQER